MNIYYLIVNSDWDIYTPLELRKDCMFNRPGVAGAVLQTPPSLIN